MTDSNILSTLWVIFSFSFLIALTGAMSPGPLLTYTIIKSVQAKNRGYLMGLWIIIGHALLEMAIIIFLLLGFSLILQNIIIMRLIGVIGGMLLVGLGFSIFRKVYFKKVSTDFLDTTGGNDKKLAGNPIIGGILVSMSNPYWWAWWATIGFAFILQFNISFRQWPKLIAFYIGHEAGDLLWYMLVSTLAFHGLRRLNKKVYNIILVICGVVMTIFGIYMGISPFLMQN